MSGDTERLVRDFCAWWEARGHDATTAEGERIARELLATSGGALSRAEVEAYCTKLKRGFAGSRTILAASEVGDALLEWLAGKQDDGGGDRSALDTPARETVDDRPLDEISWGEGAGDELLSGLDVDDLPPIPDVEERLPPLPDSEHAPLAAPDMAFDGPDVIPLDERVDAIAGRDVFAASDPPPTDVDLQLDHDADTIGTGEEAHYVREEKVSVGDHDPGLDVDVDPATRPEPPSSSPPRVREDSQDALPVLTTPPPPDKPSRQPLIIGLIVLVLVAVAAAATLAL